MKITRRQATGLLVTGWAASLLGVEAQAQKPVKALLVLVGGGPHDIEKNPPFLDKAFEHAGIQATKLAPPAGKQGDAAHLARLAELKPGDYDVLVFYTVGQSLSPEQENALQRFVESGGGVVAVHGASASFGNSQKWFNMIGARFAGHAPGTYDLAIAVSDPAHPIMKGVKDFDIHDEEYTHRFPEGVQRTVIAKFKQRPANTSEKGGNNDAVWTINQGKGRVVYTALGHGPEAWQNPMWQKLMVQSILWAAGQPREVKIGE